MKRPAPDEGPGAFALLEEAAHLVRGAPLAAAAAYLLGTAPFVLGVCFFVAEMSRGAHAAARLPGAALALVVAFAWMKAWQAVAAEHVLASLEQREPARPGVAGWLRLAARQFLIHAFGLALLPAAAVALLPLPWVYAYFHNVTVLGLSEGARTHRVALEQARLWPLQNAGALAALKIVALPVFGNVAIAIYVVPWLIRTLTGTERVFAQVGWNPLNTTFLAAALALAFLVVDPLIRAYYVLRCFYGRSRRTGLDLIVQVRSALGRAAPVLALVLACALAGTSAAQEAPSGGEGAPALEARELEAALERVLERPEYVWREPPPQPEGAAHDVATWLERQLESLERWWRGLFESREEEQEVRRSLFGSIAGWVQWVFIAAAAVLVIAVIVSVLRRSAAARPAAAAVAVTAVPALDREDLTADQLEEEEWMRLARDLIARGDVRLGMRALFLGSLAGLAGRGLLVLARHKSNRDYERELARRGAPLAGQLSAFSENRRAFEGVWYGERRPEPEQIERFEENVRLLVRKEAA